MQAVERRRRMPAGVRRALSALLLGFACGPGYGAEERCHDWGMNSRFLFKDNIAVVMRTGGGLSDPRHYLSLALPESELPLSVYFDEETRAGFRGGRRFDSVAEFLVLKTIKGDLDPVIVLSGYGVNHRTYLGKLELIALDGPLPDGTYDYSSVFRTVFHEGFSLTRSVRIFDGPNGPRRTCEPVY